VNERLYGRLFTVFSSITRSTTDASTSESASSKRAVHFTVHGVHPSKELNMNAKTSDEARVPEVPLFNEVGKPKPGSTKTSAKAGSADWLVPVGLLILSFIPIAGGAFRLTQLAGSAQITTANARFFASPLPVTMHIVSVTIFSLLGAFQFDPGFRRRHPAWHRAAGRILIPSGLVAALSGLWMTLFYPWADSDGVILYGLRLLFGSVMLGSIFLGVAAIWRRNFVQHGHWMMRGYAIGLGAGTQALTQMTWMLLIAKPDELAKAMLMGAGWVINLGVVEWVIRKRPTSPTRTASAVVPHLP
jgi:hypothetical protein